MSRWHSLSREQKNAENSRKKAWRHANLETSRAKKRAHYESKLEYYKEYERNRQYQKLYGITIADYELMLSYQNGVCAICKSEKAGKKRQHFAVDHCHSTGRIRGLLCVKCNVATGFYEKHHIAIAKYLEDA